MYKNAPAFGGVCVLWSTAVSTCDTTLKAWIASQLWRSNVCFHALLSQFISLGSSFASHDAITALLLLAIANVYGSQHIAILTAAARKSLGLSPRSSTHDSIKAVKYESIVNVLRQCDGPATSSRHPGISDGYITHASQQTPSYEPHHNNRDMQRRCMPPEEARGKWLRHALNVENKATGAQIFLPMVLSNLSCPILILKCSTTLKIRTLKQIRLVASGPGQSLSGSIMLRIL